jgi:hypothetical protein
MTDEEIFDIAEQYGWMDDFFRWNFKETGLIKFALAIKTAEWVGLTDDELEKVFPAIATYHEANKTLYRSIARAIEAKLKEKNT